ncbi:MAG: CHC2 zinc finger domain-containing protein, partial [Aeoliella sp.]
MEHGPAHDAKEQIRQAVDIVDLVGGYLQLRRQGRNFVAQCPWHDDTRPSLQVNQERQTFKCWVCDIGGDVFSFLMRMERLEFREALEMLAERTGVQLAPTGHAKVEPGSPGDKRTQLAATAWAAEQFHHCLTLASEGQSALRYLAERGISDEMQVRFQIGFSPPDWEWLVRRAHNSPFSTAVLERVGLIGSREGN